jgi:hypothetical protein
MYAGDSFFTLSVAGQLGLLSLSAFLGGLTMFVLWRMTAGMSLITRLVMAFVCFTAFVWVTPQIYYFYYQWFIGGLPWQIVIDYPPHPRELLDLLLFDARQNLSFHARGVLGWLMVVMAVIRTAVAQFSAR